MEATGTILILAVEADWRWAMEEEEEDTNTGLNINSNINISSQVVTMESVDSELRVCSDWRLSPECQQSQPPLYNFVNISWVHAPGTGPLHPHFIVYTFESRINVIDE